MIEKRFTLYSDIEIKLLSSELNELKNKKFLTHSDRLRIIELQIKLTKMNDYNSNLFL